MGVKPCNEKSCITIAYCIVCTALLLFISCLRGLDLNGIFSFIWVQINICICQIIPILNYNTKYFEKNTFFLIHKLFVHIDPLHATC